ncbi:peptidoglycan endopeptidase [Pseudoxanthomonas winnipegensis]|uniref:Peptidoglycan endopeptidase n=1 Tax=Pseudoxanthomonas winnipegensis TaxID=2480810 RepID=A0ABY1WEM1_9GAMM|nr:NlpC/P60 family protein [Pseudoxanthomonas winnipegensis]TAA12542.1 peptidoglycan endopeptidase [Pseudoxanthomonas winnipegensis]TAA19852.1 peptidoglycan endopeptidase [Pseudoxanthomonas winnipegensis]TAH70609.1 peptidoglycan endopeptidase [Pseudoxanthomonas winnipegensis]
MPLTKVEQLLGIPYDEDHFDCAEFVAHVQRQLFDRDVRLPGERPHGAEGQAAMGELSKAYASPREGAPQDGDLVLMFELGQKRPSHAGVYFRLAHEDWVLHSNEKNGCSVLHRVRELGGWGLRIEGYYAWA